tara:strand:- start:99 stop:488 length:390 start_codon:yes stop_codon:yes gene_type:complete
MLFKYSKEEMHNIIHEHILLRCCHGSPPLKYIPNDCSRIEQQAIDILHYFSGKADYSKIKRIEYYPGYNVLHNAIITLVRYEPSIYACKDYFENTEDNYDGNYETIKNKLYDLLEKYNELEKHIVDGVY